MKENGFKLAKERSRRYPAQTIMDEDYTDDIPLHANSPAQAKSQLHSLEQAAVSIGFHVSTDKAEYMCFNQRGYITTLKSSLLKLVGKFPHLGSHVSSTKNGINMWLAKALIAIDRLLVIWKSDLTDKIKCSFFQATVVSVQLYRCTTWTLTKSLAAITLECCKLYWTSPGCNTLQDSSCTATYHPSWKLS